MLKSYGVVGGWVRGGGLQDFSVSPGSGSLSLSLSKSLSEPERARESLRKSPSLSLTIDLVDNFTFCGTECECSTTMIIWQRNIQQSNDAGNCGANVQTSGILTIGFLEKIMYKIRSQKIRSNICV